MRAALRLLAPLPAHLTFYTRASCQLCANARTTLARVWDREPFEYAEIDVMRPDADAQARAYEYDVPVVHVSRTGGTGGAQTGGVQTGGAQTGADVEWKQMHYIKEEEVVGVLRGIREAREARGKEKGETGDKGGEGKE
ncbi:hypothetical protein EDC01DRAFT_626726 [Geopyxis carbonaria]|nr:hypothetical protein EDC01DRAFT_626726 [Geopyxis carbonaria]